jgi:hypothetical protein
MLGVTISACGDDSDVSTFEREGFPFTFEYPGDFELSEDVGFSQSLGQQSEEDTVALGIDDDDALILQSFTLNLEVTADNLSLAKREFDRLLQQVDPSADGEEGTIAGFPSLTYDAVDLTTPEDGISRYTVFFEGDQEYLINCQSTPAERDQIEAACDQALETLTATEDGE